MNRFNKKGIGLAFNWIFAVIVGGIILLLAIYGTMKFIGTGERIIDTESAAKLIGVLESSGAGLGSGRVSEVKFSDEVKLEFSCDYLSNRPFGLQRIKIGEGKEVNIKDKYVFSSEEVGGKVLNIFSKPFSIGFRVGDLIMVYSESENYCFVDSPDWVLEGVEGLGVNVKLVDNVGDCSGISVCFNGDDCDVSVMGDVDDGRVVKEGVEIHYIGNLVYGAIFSSKEIYECNVQRLVGRFRELALIYQEKVGLISEKGCDSVIGERLGGMRGLEIGSSEGLEILEGFGDEIVEINRGQPEGCEVW